MKVTITTETISITFNCDTYKYSVGEYCWTIATYDKEGIQLEVITIGRKRNGESPKIKIEE